MWHGIAQDSRFYFVHSFYVEPQDAQIVAVLASTA
jgi:glutamine amidotransferase